MRADSFIQREWDSSEYVECSFSLLNSLGIRMNRNDSIACLCVRDASLLHFHHENSSISTAACTRHQWDQRYLVMRSSSVSLKHTRLVHKLNLVILIVYVAPRCHLLPNRLRLRRFWHRSLFYYYLLSRSSHESLSSSGTTQTKGERNFLETKRIYRFTGGGAVNWMPMAMHLAA